MCAGCTAAGENRSSPAAASSSGGTAGTERAPTSPTERSATGGAKPAALRIPSLDLDEKPIELDLADDGTLEVPRDAGDVGWYAGGGRPGGPGPTVLAGHVDSKTGPGVFYRLTDLGPGDTILVDDERGARVTYTVDRVEDHPKEVFPTEVVFGSTVDDQLRLITCTGPYDQRAESHRDNRVVFASPK